MTPRPSVKPPRDRILDAAFDVMHSLGLANATTKQIALHAGYSEAMLYKHFDDKQALFLAVLQERIPPTRISATAASEGDLVESLAALLEHLMNFFVTAFPIAASVFSSPDLLREHRAGVSLQGRGPEEAVRTVEAYLQEQRSSGRIAADADCGAGARLLVGAAFHQGFLAAFAGQEAVVESPAIARNIAQVVARGLS